MDNHGFIMLHRKIMEHEFYKEERVFSRYEAWTDLILMANHKDAKFMLGNEEIEAKKGQVITSEKKLMDKWKWSKTKLRGFLENLEKNQMINRETDRKKTVINLVNYAFYHGEDIEEEPPEKPVKKPPKKPDETTDKISEIEQMITRYSDGFRTLNKQYWATVKETRKNGKIATSVIYNNMKKWEKYDPKVVECSLNIHISNHRGMKEEYTIGIMRNMKPEEVEGRIKGLNKPKFKPRQGGQIGEIIINDSE